jgi:UDP-glucose 4-epimerase
MYNSAKQWRINVFGSQNVFESAERAAVRKIVFASSTNAYGAHPDNPEFLTEKHPLRPNPGIQYTVEKMVAEGILQKISERNPQMVITILRPCIIVGENIRNPVVDMLKMVGRIKIKLLFSLKGFETYMQFIHEDDTIEGFYRAVVEDHPGTFNLVSDGCIGINWLKNQGVRIVQIHPKVAWLLLGFLWNFRIYNTNPNILELVKYRWTASNEKIKKEWGFKFKHTSQGAIESLL